MTTPDDNELLRRAVERARSKSTLAVHPRWAAVRDVFMLGSTSAKALCKRFGVDPDQAVEEQ